MRSRRRGRGADATTSAPRETTDWRSYDTIAEEFERLHAGHTAEPARDLVATLAPAPGARVLDVGTGTGVAAHAAQEAVGPDGVVVGVDPSVAMLRLAHAKDAEVSLAAGQAIDLPFHDHTFDVVMANFVLSHFTRYETALFDMVRVLRSGGRMGVTAWASHPDEFGRVWQEIAESFVGKDLLRDAVRRGCPWEERFADPRGLKEALRGAGIRPVEVDHHEYRFTTTLEDHLAGRETSAIARFMRQMLGPALWQRFRQRVREEFEARFPQEIGDSRDVLIATGPKR